MTSAAPRAYNGRLGAEPSAGSKGRTPWASGAKPPEAKTHLVFGRLTEATNLPFLHSFETQRNSIFVLSLQKIMGGHETRGSVEQNGGAMLSRLGIKPPPVHSPLLSLPWFQPHSYNLTVGPLWLPLSSL